MLIPSPAHPEWNSRRLVTSHGREEAAFACGQTDDHDHAVLHLAGERHTYVCGNLGDGGRSVELNWPVSSERSRVLGLFYAFSAARCERYLETRRQICSESCPICRFDLFKQDVRHDGNHSCNPPGLGERERAAGGGQLHATFWLHSGS